MLLSELATGYWLLATASMRYRRRRFLTDQASFVEATNGKGPDQVRSLTRDDQLRDALAGHRTRFEAVGAPAYVQDEATDLWDRAHDRAVVGRHIADAGPLSQDAH